MARSLNKLSKGQDVASAKASSSRAVPLDLSALLAPYKGKGRLTVRIERLPQLARLSAGQNNGDQSWSLAPDELDGLTYTPPEGLNENHSLSIRIIAKNDSEALTLGLLDFPVVLVKEIGEPATIVTSIERKQIRVVESVSPANDPTSEADIEARITRELEVARAAWQAELDQHLAAAGAKAAEEVESNRWQWQTERDALLVEKEKEIANRLAEALQGARHEAQNAIYEAEKVWRQDEASRLAAVEAQWQSNVQSARADADTRLAAVRQQGEIASAQLRDELTKIHTAVAERETSLGQAQLSVEILDQQWQQKLGETLASAEKSWKAEEAARFAAAETQWQAIAQKARSDADMHLAAVRHQGEIANTQLRDELAKIQAAHGERESSLNRNYVSVEKMDERWQQMLGEALSSAETSWKAEEDARLSAAEAQWRANLQKVRVDAEIQLTYVRHQGEIACAQLRDELAKTQANYAERQAGQNNSAENMGERLQHMLGEALASAETVWKAQESVRLAAAEARLKAQFEHTLADVRAAAAANTHNKTDEADLALLRDAVTAMKGTLASRETELAQLHAAYQRQQREAEEAVAQAKADSKAEEAERLKATEVQWQKRFADSLAEATARCESAEAALETARGKEANQVRDEDAYTRSLSREVRTLRSALVDREADLAKANAYVDEMRNRIAPDPITGHRPHPMRQAPDESSERGGWRDHIVRDVGILAFVVVAVVLFLPKSFLPASFQQQAPVKTAALSTPPPKAAYPLASIRRSVNLRAQPSATADILANLKQDVQVAILDRQGAWVHAQVSGPDGNPLQGWVFGTYLDDGSDKAAAPQAPALPSSALPVTVRPAEAKPSNPASSAEAAPQTPVAPVAQQSPTAPEPASAADAAQPPQNP